jgi:hypothetical protein
LATGAAEASAQDAQPANSSQVALTEEKPVEVDVRKIDNLIQEALLGKESPAVEGAEQAESAREVITGKGSDHWSAVASLINRLERESLAPMTFAMARKFQSDVSIQACPHASISQLAQPQIILMTVVLVMALIVQH